MPTGKPVGFFMPANGGRDVAYYEIKLSVVTEDEAQAAHISETLNRVATGLALEGIQSAQSIDIDDDYYGDEEDAEQAAGDNPQPY